jgi:LysM repeat protein
MKMKKIWSTYSYTIILLAISCFAALVLNVKADLKEDNYLRVTVESGDTLWELANVYATDSNMSTKQFIDWVNEQNAINDNLLHPGDELIVPIKNITINANTELASAIGE